MFGIWNAVFRTATRIEDPGKRHLFRDYVGNNHRTILSETDARRAVRDRDCNEY